MSDWHGLVRALGEQGIDLLERRAPDAARVIGSACRGDTVAGPVFLKTCRGAEYERLAAEAEGLAELRSAGVIRVPGVLALVRTEAAACLALEWLAFESPDADVERRFGRALAALHRRTRERFGWHRHNTIGLTPQINAADDDWARFFRDNRLGYQLELAGQNGYGGELEKAGAALLADLGRLLAGHSPDASLLHGDLWAGNWGSVEGRPVVFDPAVYYGDRETDLAMTRLFGGFGRPFYSAYEAEWPLPPGHEQRLLLYQLYHVLNHLNLFGEAWLGRALQIMRQLNRR